jgi:hypothetical protein
MIDEGSSKPDWDNLTKTQNSQQWFNLQNIYLHVGSMLILQQGDQPKKDLSSWRVFHGFTVLTNLDGIWFTACLFLYFKIFKKF